MKCWHNNLPLLKFLNKLVDIMRGLAQKSVILTGGAGVIGSAICKALASHKVNLAILDLDKDKCEKLADEISATYQVKAIGIQSNVLDRASLQSAKDRVIVELGDYHFLINGAGGNSPKATAAKEFIDKDSHDNLQDTFFGLDLDGFQKVFDLNFTGTLLPTMVFGEHLIKQQSGVILNVSSMNAFRPLTKIPAYSAAKASVNNLTEWLAVHFAKSGVRVNAIAPGFLLTDQNRFLLTEEGTGNLTARGKTIIQNTPMGKYGEPEDITGSVAFLLSEEAAFITGVTLPIDGGFNAFSGV